MTFSENLIAMIVVESLCLNREKSKGYKREYKYLFHIYFVKIIDLVLAHIILLQIHLYQVYLGMIEIIQKVLYNAVLQSIYQNHLLYFLQLKHTVPNA
jgi:hypothetical protein